MAWLRTRRAFRSVVFYLNYLGVENFYDANITSVTLGVYAMRGELLPAQEYTTNWYALMMCGAVLCCSVFA